MFVLCDSWIELKYVFGLILLTRILTRFCKGEELTSQYTDE